MAGPVTADRSAGLQTLLRDARLWRGDGAAPLRATPTGLAALDALLPGGGWPLAALSEIIYPVPGVGELQLAMPLLARLTHARRPVALIAPPYDPYAPALQQQGLVLNQLIVVETLKASDALWAAEDLLRAHAGAVLLWQDGIEASAQRRLQLAAESGDSLALVYRRRQYTEEISVAALRLGIERVGSHAEIEVLKCRGARPRQRCTLQ